MRRIWLLAIASMLAACSDDAPVYYDGSVTAAPPTAVPVTDCTLDGQRARALVIGGGDQTRTDAAARVIGENCRNAALNQAIGAQ